MVANVEHSQSSTAVVNGLDVSELTEAYLEMLQTGGVHCWHKSMGGLRTFSDAYHFVDQHTEQITVVRYVWGSG